MSLLSGIRIQHGAADEAEKPFWISYADLMTSLMILFLVVMLAALASLTRTVLDLQQTKSQSEVLAQKYRDVQKERREERRRADRREKRIDNFWKDLGSRSRGLGIRIKRNTNVIDFGDKARFATGSDVLSGEGQRVLRRFAPALLAVADSIDGRAVLNRVVVEGYADRRGPYLYNLNLSLNRSQRVLCSLLAPGGNAALSGAQKGRVRDLFLVGGFSFNASRKSLAASRRVEMKLEFLPLGAQRKSAVRQGTSFGDCALD
jgi:outer membrane protein OmpA-like peptidoglycan-associated protein